MGIIILLLYLCSPSEVEACTSPTVTGMKLETRDSKR
jgi:hypothetical protein